MIKDKETLFLYLVDQFPDFKKNWNSEENYNVFEDGSFSSSGLCAEFSQYYIDEFNSIDRRKLEGLFSSIEMVLGNSGLDNQLLDLASSLKSCFLENISQTEAGEASKEFMGKATRCFFDDWHVYP